ncbi:hypothetical protein C7T94_04680 [Pedobacter yulinensis]|uniref:YfhO family protein n=1 Tax=Pedobacter yulinensis TaxID=2126353 RepID=A0A2T3HNQ1_9SPHI|nr:hypothetical protein [Pedobacter yulinensis]PST84037.1 hypothetical protein C7T94_04680 [Pedobacter yulinensis]
MNNWLKKNGIHLAIVAFFIIICFVYFSPVLQGKAPSQGDVLQAKAMAKEIMDVRAKDGKGPLWTNQMFGGMPAFQIWVKYPMNITTYGIDIIKGLFPDPVGTVLLYLLGAYFLFCVLRANPWLAAAGAIAFAFTSYNFIIIAAGHSNQALTIGFFAPILASIILTLRGRYLLGASLTALFLALNIRANHVQMTYYFFTALLIYIAIEVYHAYKQGRMKEFGRSFAYLAAAGLVALLVNAGTLWTTYEYSKYTIRGQANLSRKGEANDHGLTKEYAYAYSQGPGESFTVLIPNLYGGAPNIDQIVKPESKTYKTLQGITGGDPTQAIYQLYQNLGFQQYWGDKPLVTGGPFYFGAIICMLFIFGLVLVKNRLKWWVAGTTVLFFLLSFGGNFPIVSDIFFDYVPLYNKFRAVESILAVVGLLVPLLAVLAVREALEGQYDEKYVLKKLYIAGGITGGFTLIVLVLPTLLFSFTSANHNDIVNALTQMAGNDRGVGTNIANALVQDRISIAREDALRTLIFLAIGFALTWAMVKKKVKAEIALVLLALAVLVDMWQVDRRYLNNQNFVAKSSLQNHYEPRDVDNFILADKDPNFRVMDLSLGNPFSNVEASYFHKTVGGFHSARLMRFQELIDHQFSKSINQDVLDMLNTKYIITRNPENGAYGMQRNETACGNAWFVQSVQYVKNADEEMKAISSFNPKNEAIVDVRFKKLLEERKAGLPDANASIKLESYHPDKLVYKYSTSRDMVAVFSEIYYDKGWKMYVDNVEKPYFRADWLLRAAVLEGGNHTVEFRFEPTSYYAGEKISLFGSVLLIAGLAFAIYSEQRNRKRVTAK